MTPPSPEQREALRHTLGSERVRESVPLAPFTTFQIGGPADLYYEATTSDELARAILAAKESGLPWFLLGLGANILVGDRGFRGLVIRNRAQAVEFDPQKTTVRAESGAVV
ncbi:MAG: FAD-binding protein, partial [Acidobacteriota bacterium]